MALIPTCPKCGEAHTLKLTDDKKIRCVKVNGGCGAMFTLDEFPNLYRDDTAEPAKPSSTPKRRRKP